jgi:hypothetical protein
MRRSESRITHPYPYLPIRGRQGPPKIPPVVRMWSSLGLARERRAMFGGRELLSAPVTAPITRVTECGAPKFSAPMLAARSRSKNSGPCAEALPGSLVGGPAADLREKA